MGGSGLIHVTLAGAGRGTAYVPVLQVHPGLQFTDGGPTPVDAYRAMEYSVPSIISEQSIAQGGIPIPAPDMPNLAS